MKISIEDLDIMIRSVNNHRSYGEDKLRKINTILEAFLHPDLDFIFLHDKFTRVMRLKLIRFLNHSERTTRFLYNNISAIAIKHYPRDEELMEIIKAHNPNANLGFEKSER